MSEKMIDIINETGRKYPYSVPDGYFDNLTSRIMANIPECEGESATIVSLDKKKASPRKVRPLWLKVTSVAASLVLVALISLKLFDGNTTSYGNTEEFASNEEYVMDEAELYYSVMSNAEVYCMLESYSDEAEE